MPAYPSQIVRHVADITPDPTRRRAPRVRYGIALFFIVAFIFGYCLAVLGDMLAHFGGV